MRGFCFLSVSFCLCFLYSVLCSAQSVNVHIDSIIITGNTKTNDHIILRELTFAQGDSVAISRLAGMMDSSVSNLKNTPLFLEVFIDFTPLNREEIIIRVDVKERWYIFPLFSIALADRNFNVWWFEQDHKLSRLEYGVGLVYYNLTGNNDPLRINTIFGFSNKYELSYDLPFFNSKTNVGAGAAFLYQTNKQIYYTTENNTQIFFEGEDRVREKLKALIELHTRTNLYSRLALRTQYNAIQIADTIAELNPQYLGNGQKQLDFMSVAVKYTSNHTDNRQYPLKGYFWQAELQKIGFGKQVDQVTAFAQINGYKPLSDKIFLNGMLAAKTNFSQNYPYYLTESLGYCEYFVRGYEYYVVDGQSTYLTRNNIKWKCIDWNVEAPVINAEKFKKIPVQVYLKIFADAGYVTDNYYSELNPLTNTFLYSGGIGVDITTYYDWVFRAEAAVNGLGELGVFLHVGLDLNTYEACNLW